MQNKQNMQKDLVLLGTEVLTPKGGGDVQAELTSSQTCLGIESRAPLLLFF
jgi:hypothetical protein